MNPMPANMYTITQSEHAFPSNAKVISYSFSLRQETELTSARF